VVVSGAAGATGSVVGQIAKARGAKKVVGIAGGAEKCSEVVEMYGFDECLDYANRGSPSVSERPAPRVWTCTSTTSVAPSSTRRSPTFP